MRILLFLSAIILLGTFCSQSFAYHSVANPMSPRSLKKEKVEFDYSYGLAILPDRSIDAIEGVNRSLPWKTNFKVIDKHALKPVAHAWVKTPQFIQTGSSNFVSNIDDFTSFFNNLACFNFVDSLSSLGRFTINSTIGVLGFFDVASKMKIPVKHMSFDTVLGKYGVDSGSYIMIPMVGPTTERSMHGKMVDSVETSLLTPFITVPYLLLNTVSSRAKLIPQEELIYGAADPYAQTRQFYLQYSEGKVNPDAALKIKADKNVDEFLEEID